MTIMDVCVDNRICPSSPLGANLCCLDNLLVFSQGLIGLKQDKALIQWLSQYDVNCWGHRLALCSVGFSLHLFLCQHVGMIIFLAWYLESSSRNQSIMVSIGSQPFFQREKNFSQVFWKVWGYFMTGINSRSSKETQHKT